MDATSHGKEAISPGPDPSPHLPSRFTPPPGSVDAHAHVVGPSEAMVEERSYTPPPAPPESYLRMLDSTGMTFGVLVQVSVHGTDNSLLLAALRANPERLRGVAVIDPATDDAALAELAASGVRGLRMNTVTGGGIGLDHLDRYEAICAEMGWHLQLLANADSLRPAAARLAKLRVPYVIDNMGDFDVEAGPGSPGWQFILGLVRDGAWVKFDGVYRLAKPPYADALPFAQSLVAAAPDRCVYGSDWPHTGFWGPMPNDGDLLDLLADWAPDQAQRDAILTTNAHRLYGFTGDPNHGKKSSE
jgi:2-pyrone-4,6-dicarboxylate lactonase